LCELLRKVQRTSGLTTLHVTHSRAEAAALADRLLIVESGRLSERPVAALDQVPDDLLIAGGRPR